MRVQGKCYIQNAESLRNIWDQGGEKKVHLEPVSQARLRAFYHLFRGFPKFLENLAYPYTL